MSFAMPVCHRAASLALVLGMLSLTGCLAVAAGGAALSAYKYEANEVARDYSAGLDVTWQAAIASLQENGYAIGSDAAHGATSGLLAVDNVRVRVEAHAQGFTRVRVRIGTFETSEHRRRAELILAGIQRRLGA